MFLPVQYKVKSATWPAASGYRGEGKSRASRRAPAARGGWGWRMRAEVELLLLEADPGAVKLLRWPLAVVDEGPRRWRSAGRRPEKTEEEAGVGGAPAAACGGG